MRVAALGFLVASASIWAVTTQHLMTTSSQKLTATPVLRPPASAHTDSFIRYFARTVATLPEGTMGPETVQACLDSVPVPERVGAYAALCWAGRELEVSSFGSFDGRRPAQAASDLVDCNHSNCARETLVPDCYYPQPLPCYRRGDVHMGPPLPCLRRHCQTFYHLR